MNQQFWRGFTATVLMTVPGLACFSHAEVSRGVSRRPEAQPSQFPEVSTPVSHTTHTGQEGTAIAQASETIVAADVVKVGERQSQAIRSAADAVIAKIQSHQISGRKAATLYVRDIPVLTFLGSTAATQSDTKMGVAANQKNSLALASFSRAIQPVTALRDRLSGLTQSTSPSNPNDPVWRATAIAAKLNQMNFDHADGKDFTVKWEDRQEQYSIQLSGKPFITLDAATLLPDSTRDPEQDALQVTNRLRRLVGNAPPLKAVIGRPRSTSQVLAFRLRGNAKVQQVRAGIARLSSQGLASWYGPGFHGAQSASGEIFNQDALTAAHRSLPFGTRVRVTNLDNGRSVVVRINDRGPFAPGRVIDLSAAAANLLGLIRTGVAPVQLDVLSNRAPAATAEN